jgi:hypothetical protein
MGLRKIPFVLLMISLFWLALSLPAGAESFKTEVRIILASNSDQGFDPRLLDLKQDLLALNYQSFQLLEQSGISIEKGKTGILAIPGNRRLELTPSGFEGGKISMKVRIIEGEKSLLSTRLRIENHGTMILGGPPHEAGFLVLAVTANY